MKKTTLTIVIVIGVLLLVAGALAFVLLKKDDNKPKQNENTTNTTTNKNDPTLGEDDGYYELKQNINEDIHNSVCNEELCVIIKGISFLGDNGGIIFNIYPNDKFNKEPNQSGHIKLKFNNTCEDNIIIADYDFNNSKDIEKEVQTTCTDFLETDKYFISVPTEEEINEYSLKHAHED